MNPFSDQATLSIQLKNERLSGQLQIIDVLGHIVQSYQVEDAKNIVIHRAELRSGVYFFQFIDNRNRLMTGRLVVE